MENHLRTAQGDLLGSLELADPSKVKKIGTFDGTLSFASGAIDSETTLQAFRSSQKQLELVMDGYSLDADASVAKLLASLSSYSLVIGEVADAASMLGQKMPVELDGMLQQVYESAKRSHVDGEDTAEAEKLVATMKAAVDEYVNSLIEAKRAGMYATLAPVTAMIEKYEVGLRQNAIDVVCGLLSKYVAVESAFVGKSTDQAIGELVKANADSLDVVYKTALAHEALKARTALCNTLLRSLAEFPERFGVEPLVAPLPPALDVVVTMSQMTGSAYKELALTAANFGLLKAEKPFDEAVTELRAELEKSADVAAKGGVVDTKTLQALFNDEKVGDVAMEAAIRRWYRTFTINSLTTNTAGDDKYAEFTYQAADVTQGDEPVPERYGMLALVSKTAGLADALPSILDKFSGSGPNPYNALHIAFGEELDTSSGSEEGLIASTQALLAAAKDKLVAKGVRVVSLMVPNAPKNARQFSFRASLDFAEDPMRRAMYPTMPNLLELDRLSNWSPSRLSAISHNSVVMLGQQGAKPRQQQRVCVRGGTHNDALVEPANAEKALQKALDELQLAVLNKDVAPSASSHLFMHVLTPFDMSPEALINQWKELMSGLISRHATRLLGAEAHTTPPGRPGAATGRESAPPAPTRTP
jgi:hypothetical protein